MNEREGYPQASRQTDPALRRLEGIQVNNDIPIIESPEPIRVINDDGTAGTAPVGNSTTIYNNLKGMPPFIVNRRNRALNRAKIDKVNRNRKSLRILRNARKRQIAQTGHSDLPDVRLDPRDRNEFAVSKPLFRGAKEAGRATRHIDRLIEALDDQRIRRHLFDLAVEDLDAKYPVWRGDPETGRGCTPEEDKAWNDGLNAARDKYLNLLVPVKTYENRGPLNKHFVPKDT